MNVAAEILRRRKSMTRLTAPQSTVYLLFFILGVFHRASNQASSAATGLSRLSKVFQAHLRPNKQELQRPVSSLLDRVEQEVQRIQTSKSVGNKIRNGKAAQRCEVADPKILL
jgi:hypothetical protein